MFLFLSYFPSFFLSFFLLAFSIFTFWIRLLKLICRFKERSLINKLKPIKDVSCGIVLFEASLMDCDGSKVVLNYCVKFQIKSNNGYAAKKRRLQDINSGVGTKKKKEKKSHSIVSFSLSKSLFTNSIHFSYNTNRESIFHTNSTLITNSFLSSPSPHIDPTLSYYSIIFIPTRKCFK